MTRIVRTAYRYQRPPRKRQAPAVVKASQRTRPKPAPAAPPPAASAIVTIRSRKGAMLAHLLEDMTPEEHRRRGDAADALFRKVVRRIGETT